MKKKFTMSHKKYHIAKWTEVCCKRLALNASRKKVKEQK